MESKTLAAKASIGVNLALITTKALAAFVTGSLGLYAEAIHSFFDLLASVLAYLGIRKAEEPDDNTHNFGHEKFENLSSLLQALLITGTASVVIFEAYKKFSVPPQVEYSEIGIALMLVSIPVTYLTSKYLENAAGSEGSAALEADSAHFTTDTISAFSVLAGLMLVRLGYGFGDPLSAAIVGVIMLYISVKLLLGSFFVFMDFSPNEQAMAGINKMLCEEKRITRFHKLRARVAGSKILVDVHIHVPHSMQIIEAHRISHEIETKLIREVPKIKEVTIHIEPD